MFHVKPAALELYIAFSIYYIVYPTHEGDVSRETSSAGAIASVTYMSSPEDEAYYYFLMVIVILLQLSSSTVSVVTLTPSFLTVFTARSIEL